MIDAESTPLLRVRDLQVEFKGRRRGSGIKAVDGVSFDVEEGETLGLVGESGCGKSTTGRAIMRKFDLREGAVNFRGEDISGLSGSDLKRMRRDLQLVFQDPYGSLNPRMSVLNIVAE